MKPKLAKYSRAKAIAFFLLLAAALAARAAGGHHAVDDAAIVEEGQCQVETWREYERGRTLLHEGPACRLGSAEVGLNFDQQRSRAGSARTGRGAQIKYATSSEGPLNIGVVVGAYRWTGPGDSVFSVLVPLTWQATPSLALHVNFGQNWAREVQDFSQKGVALEWSATARWQLIGEWYSIGSVTYRRAGARYVLNDAWSLDASYATSRRVPLWTTGLTWTFDSRAGR